MKNIVVKLAYTLESSKSYYKTKHFFYELLEDEASKKRKYFDFFMIFLVLSTVAILIYEVKHPILPWLNTYEAFAIIVFIIEWLCRLWVSSHSRKTIIADYEKSELLNKPYKLSSSLKKIAKEKIHFIFSPMSIIDLLAILPYFRPLRILRILMLFRLFKILRYTSSIKQYLYVFIEKKFEFLTLTILFLMAVTFGSSIIYIYEGAGVNPNINSFFDAAYWSVITISTVGFGDIAPITTQGRLATLFLVIGGMGVIAFFTSIVTTSLHEKLAVIKEDKTIGEANSLNAFSIICGFGRMGQVVAKELHNVDKRFIIVDNDEEHIHQANMEKYLTLLGDATDSSLLLKIGLSKGATNILALTEDDAVNLSIILTAKANMPSINIIARANTSAAKKKLLLAGANHVVFTNEIAAIVATEYIGQPVAFNAIEDILLNEEGATLDEIEIQENSKFINKSLNNIEFSQYNLTLLGIIESKNKNFLFNPKQKKYILKDNDILIVIGYKESITELKVDLLSTKG